MKISAGSLASSVAALVLLGALGVGAYYYETKVLNPPPCSSPIGYYVGTIDPRFGEGGADFEQALKEAAAVWNTAAGKTVLSENPQGTLPVNLIYDTRQQTAQLGTVITKEQSAYEQKKAQVDALKSQYESAKAAYQTHQQAFATENQQYSAQVAYWNARGGAPSEEYATLADMRAKLQSDQQALNTEADALNKIADSINTAVGQLNALAQNTNQKVDTYNAEAGTDFEQGEYVADASGKRINLYEFKSHQELVRALAHEFGHALGLGHNQDPASVMYPYNKGTSTALSAEDIAALRAACKL